MKNRMRVLLSITAVLALSAVFAHQKVTIAPGPAIKKGAFVTYYFNKDKEALFAENMREVTAERDIQPPHDAQHPGSQIPDDPPQVDNGNDTKSYVKRKCPITLPSSRTLAEWLREFDINDNDKDKKPRYAAYYAVDDTSRDMRLKLLAVEDVDTVDRTRAISLLCKDGDHCNAAHKCTVPCGSTSGCCCP
jgi:hypothetical protein